MRTIIIDANNLLYKIHKSKRQQRDGGGDRLSLLESVKSRLEKRIRIVFVFDGFGETRNPNLIFSGNKSADEVIRKYIENFSNHKLLTVVSSDNYVKRFARICGCKVQNSEDFWLSINRKEHPTKDKNINQNFIYDTDEKPSGMSKKDLNEFRKYFT
jgi:hypothetical protein